MNLKQYVSNLNVFLKENPTAGEYIVLTSRDDEGNGFNEVYYGATVGHYTDRDRDFMCQTHIDEMVGDEDCEVEDYPLNAVCVN